MNVGVADGDLIVGALNKAVVQNVAVIFNRAFRFVLATVIKGDCLCPKTHLITRFSDAFRAAIHQVGFGEISMNGVVNSAWEG